MGSKNSSLKKVRKMSATFLQRKGNGAVPAPGQRVKTMSSKRIDAALNKQLSTNVAGQNYTFEPKELEMDPRQEELKEVEFDPKASAAEVMRARVKSRRFDLNMHLEDDDAEDDDDDEEFGNYGKEF